MQQVDRPLALLAMPPLGRLRESVEAHCRVIPLKEIADRPAFFAGEGRQVRIIVTGGSYPLGDAMFEAMPHLGLIACFGSGYEGVDLQSAWRRGIVVTNAPHVNHDDVADLAIGLMISAIRRLPEADQVVRGGLWKGLAPLSLTPSMRDLRYGIVGLGAIGSAIAERLGPFGGQVAWWGHRPKPEARWPRAGSLIELAANSDVLLLAHRVGADNRGMIDGEVLEALGPTGYLVNVSRGTAIDQAALIAALRAGRLAGAALDVFEREPTDPAQWQDVPNIVLSPHIGGWAVGSIRQAEALIGRNIASFLNGQAPITPVTVSA